MAFNVNMNPLVNASINSANMLQGLGRNIGQGVANYQQNQEAEAKQQEFEILMGKAYDGDDNAIKGVFMANPEMGQHFAAMKADRINRLGIEQDQLISEKNMNYATKIALAESPEEKEQLKLMAIRDPESDFLDKDDIDEDAKGVTAAAKMYLYPNMPKGAYDEFFGAQKQDELPADAQGFNDLIKDFTPEQQKAAKLVKAGLKGRAVSDAVMTGIQNGTIKNYADAKAEIKQAEKFAEATGSSRARIIDKGFDSINKANISLGNIDKAIRAIDKGAGVGAIERLWPSITAASVELDNIRNQMALDVVGATTFGALSEGELSLAKDVALPTGLDTAQLKDYLQRKKVAQEKLRDYYNDQVQHLDQGGTVASFLRKKERENQGSNNQAGDQQQNQDQQALQWAQANPNDPRAAAILNKLGVK